MESGIFAVQNASHNSSYSIPFLCHMVFLSQTVIQPDFFLAATIAHTLS